MKTYVDEKSHWPNTINFTNVEWRWKQHAKTVTRLSLFETENATVESNAKPRLSYPSCCLKPSDKTP